jgi:hypothetical protein
MLASLLESRFVIPTTTVVVVVVSIIQSLFFIGRRFESMQVD